MGQSAKYDWNEKLKYEKCPQVELCLRLFNVIMSWKLSATQLVHNQHISHFKFTCLFTRIIIYACVCVCVNICLLLISSPRQSRVQTDAYWTFNYPRLFQTPNFRSPITHHQLLYKLYTAGVCLHCYATISHTHTQYYTDGVCGLCVSLCRTVVHLLRNASNI